MSAEQFDEDSLFLRWAVILAVGVGITVGGRAWVKKHRHGGTHVKTAASATVSPMVALSGAPLLAPGSSNDPPGLAIELWLKSPESLAARIAPRLPVKMAPPPYMAQLIVGGFPKELHEDLAILDFDKPMGVLFLEAPPPLPTDKPGTDRGMRNVIAIPVRDLATAPAHVAHFADGVKATKERSAKLGVDVYRGAQTGKYIGLIGAHVLLATDLASLEDGAGRLRAGYVGATTQVHDLVGKTPRNWLTSSLTSSLEKTILATTLQGLGGGAAPGQDSVLADLVKTARSSWVGAEEIELFADFGDQNAIGTAHLAAKLGSPFAAFLSGLPAGTPQALESAPREAASMMAVRFPDAWIETLRKLAATPPPPGVEIPKELLDKRDSVFNQLAAVLTGDVMLATFIDPPQNGAGNGLLLRIKVKAEDAAKKAAHETLKFMLGDKPPGPITAFPDGEAMEITLPAEGNLPASPPIGIAWLVKDGYVYLARGTTPKARLLKATSGKPEDRAGGDADVRTMIAGMPARVMLATLSAPLRSDTGIAKMLGETPSAGGFTLGLEPTTTGVSASVRIDMNLFARDVVLPMLIQPVPGGPQGHDHPGGHPPGGLPIPGVPGGPPGGIPPGKPPGDKPPGKPPAYVPPPVPTGYVLPVPTHTSGL